MADPDDLLARIRTLTGHSYLGESGTRALVRAVRDLDSHLSMGGTPPEAWREGPDAPELDDERPAMRPSDFGIPEVYGRDDDYTPEAIDRDAVLAPLTGPQSELVGLLSRAYPDGADPLGPPNPAGVELPQ